MRLSSGSGNSKVYVLIVNYNGYRDTIDCLGSLQKVVYPNINILVIDNASNDNSVERISEWLGSINLSYAVFDHDDSFSIENKVTIIKTKSNLGFGGANNVGIRIALKHGVPLVLLLNNDTIVESHFLCYMIETMYSSNRIGIVGGKIYHLSDKKKIWYCGGWIDFIRGAAYHVEKDLRGILETRLVTGCLALLNLKAIEGVGLFDERFFLNVEDWDLSYRMRKACWRLCIDTNAVIFHKISGSIGGGDSLRNQYYFHRNRLLFFYKHLGFIKKVFFFLGQSVIMIVWLIKHLLKGNFVLIKGFFWGTTDFFLGRFGLSTRV